MMNMYLQLDRRDDDRAFFKPCVVEAEDSEQDRATDFQRLKAMCELGQLSVTPFRGPSKALQEHFELSKLWRSPEGALCACGGVQHPPKRGLPYPLILIRGAVHDCALPDLELNEERRELSLSWKKLFTAFFAAKKTARDRFGGVSNLDPNLNAL